MDYSTFVQQNKQYQFLLSQFGAGKLNHVCLLKTADTNFAQSICYSLAAKIVDCSDEKINKNIHPDVQIFGADGKIDVASANNIISSLAIRPYSANSKVYCLLMIENMNETTQNKLLKSLEEPPKDVFFLMTCANTKNVLSTVLSRALVLDVDSLKNEQIEQLLLGSKITQQIAQVAVSCSNGNSTLAAKLASQNFMNLYESVLQMLENVNGSKDCLEYSSIFDSKSVDKNEVLDICMLFVRDVMMILSGAENLLQNKHHKDALLRISKTLSLDACTKIIDVCLKLKENLFFNANGTMSMDSLLLTVAEEKTKCKKLLA